VTFEEKLEEMRERMDMSVRIHMDFQRESDERWARYEEAYQLRQKLLDEEMAKLMQTMNMLGRIAGLHEDRLDHHERRLDDIEGGQ